MPTNSSNIKIVITGAKGQLGLALSQLLHKNTDYLLWTFDSSQLDISNRAAVFKSIEEIQPHIIINAAAYTKVDDAEVNINLARAVNVDGPKYLAQAASRTGAHLIHFSSDYVYHSVTDRPILETDPCSPKSIYAQSKLDGDHQVIAHLQNFTIIRTSWVYGPGGHNFVYTMLRLADKHETLNIVSDQIGSPTLSLDIADLCLSIIKKIIVGEGQHCTGIFNYSNRGQISWADFARKIFEIKQLAVNVVGIDTESYGAAALRPKWSVLSLNKIENLLNIRATDWDLRLFEFLEKYS